MLRYKGQDVLSKLTLFLLFTLFQIAWTYEDWAYNQSVIASSVGEDDPNNLINGVWQNSSDDNFTHGFVTEVQKNPWILIDLKKNITIKTIEIYPHLTKNGIWRDQLLPFYMTVDGERCADPKVEKKENPDEASPVVVVCDDKPGRYVKLHVEGRCTNLSLNEIRVLGEIVPSNDNKDESKARTTKEVGEVFKNKDAEREIGEVDLLQKFLKSKRKEEVVDQPTGERTDGTGGTRVKKAREISSSKNKEKLKKETRRHSLQHLMKEGQKIGGSISRQNKNQGVEVKHVLELSQNEGLMEKMTNSKKQTSEKSDPKSNGKEKGKDGKSLSILDNFDVEVKKISEFITNDKMKSILSLVKNIALNDKNGLSDIGLATAYQIKQFASLVKKEGKTLIRMAKDEYERTIKEKSVNKADKRNLINTANTIIAKIKDVSKSIKRINLDKLEKIMFNKERKNNVNEKERQSEVISGKSFREKEKTLVNESLKPSDNKIKIKNPTKEGKNGKKKESLQTVHAGHNELRKDGQHKKEEVSRTKSFNQNTGSDDPKVPIERRSHKNVKDDNEHLNKMNERRKVAMLAEIERLRKRYFKDSRKINERHFRVDEHIQSSPKRRYRRYVDLMPLAEVQPVGESVGCSIACVILAVTAVILLVGIVLVATVMFIHTGKDNKNVNNNVNRNWFMVNLSAES